MDLEKFPWSGSAHRMLSYVTNSWYDNSYVGKWMYEVMGREIDTVYDIFTCQLPLQFFIETATWGLRYHELKYGLPVREELTYEERRNLLKLKRDSKYSMTPYHMESILMEQLGIEVHVNDINDPGEFSFEHPNIFSVQFVQDGDGRLFDALKAKELIDWLKLSHTVYIFRYLLLLWVRQDIAYNAGLVFHTDVSAISEDNYGYRKNFLNGEYELDGHILLNGYKEINAFGRFIEADAVWATGYEVPTETEAYITIGKNLWHLDGEYDLSGEKLLNAEEYTLAL